MIEVSVTESRERTSVRCAGELDVSSAAALEAAIDTALGRIPQTLVVDAQGVTLLGSAGIDVLLRTARRCLDEGIRFRLVLSDHARHVLDVVGLWWLGAIPDAAAVDEAIEGFRSRYVLAREQGLAGGGGAW